MSQTSSMGRVSRKPAPLHDEPPLTPPASAVSQSPIPWESPQISPKTTDPNRSLLFSPMSAEEEDEYHRLTRARLRLSKRKEQLRGMIAECNDEMDIVRRKLCKDLEVLEVLKEEIEKAGTGSLRDQLEQDFHNEYLAYVATLTRQKEQVEEMQRQRVTAQKELDGIAWSDAILEERTQELKSNEM